MRTERQGFTLIELLVVIAIIAVLIALLLTGGAVGARGGAAGPVHQQPQADRRSPCTTTTAPSGRSRLAPYPDLPILRILLPDGQLGARLH